MGCCHQGRMRHKAWREQESALNQALIDYRQEPPCPSMLVQRLAKAHDGALSGQAPVQSGALVRIRQQGQAAECGQVRHGLEARSAMDIRLMNETASFFHALNCDYLIVFNNRTRYFDSSTGKTSRR